MDSPIGEKLGYRLGTRPVEKILAVCLSMAVVFRFGVMNSYIPVNAGMGLMVGVIAVFFIHMLGVSAITEGWLIMAAVIVIGLKYGAAAFGMSLVGWLLFSAIYLAIVLVSNRLLDGHW